MWVVHFHLWSAGDWAADFGGGLGITSSTLQNEVRVNEG